MSLLDLITVIAVDNCRCNRPPTFDLFDIDELYRYENIVTKVFPIYEMKA
jgi:hypothetical protein